MFNFSLYPYARWLGDGSLDDVPGFNIGESEVPPGNGGFRRRNVCSAADATISELAANAGVNPASPEPSEISSAKRPAGIVGHTGEQCAWLSSQPSR